MLQRDTQVDEKWQLYLPAEMAERMGDNEEVFVLVDGSGCVHICPFWVPEVPFGGTAVRLRKTGPGRKYARITIPQEFRSTKSFHYGRTVTVVCKKKSVVVWPRPPWKERESVTRVRPRIHAH